MTGERGIHASALPNGLAAEDLHLRPVPGGGLVVDPDRAGWRYLGFRSLRLGTDDSAQAGGAGVETVLVVVGGGGAELRTASGDRIELPGRKDPFEDLPWAAYLPAGTTVTVTGRPSDPIAGVDVAIAAAPVRPGRHGVVREVITISPDDVAVEIRGRGNATRQVNHIVPPGFPADRLLIVEVLTPAGNWSSWPPHKHDIDDMPVEAVLEEIYYYRVRRTEGWGLQRVYRSDGTRDAVWAVGDGDLVLVTDGYHPFVAAHGYDAYYLNALAGDRRTMACSFDPALDWTRSAWANLEPDPRVPLVRPSGWPRSIDAAVSGVASRTWGSTRST